MSHSEPQAQPPESMLQNTEPGGTKWTFVNEIDQITAGRHNVNT